MGKRVSTDDFIEKAQKVHGDRYDYSKVIYNKCNTKVKIICSLHGEFLQTPSAHTFGQGCPVCKGIKNGVRCSSTTKDFIKKAEETHGNLYNYSKTSYVNNYTKIEIVCKKHGSFFMLPSNHTHKHQKQGCPVCGREKMFKTTGTFIIESTKIHKNKYDYSRVSYEHNRKKVEIICPLHGSFFQTPDVHLRGRGCSKCNSSKGELLIKDYLDKKSIKYDYQKKFSDCKYQNLLLFDFYTSFKNVFIEYNGEQHYIDIPFFTKNGNSRSFENQQKRYDIKKSYAESKGIFLEIRYDDDIEKRLEEVYNHV